MAKENPPERAQLNVRLDDELKCLLADLAPMARDATGLNVTQSDLVRLGLKALAREYKRREAKAENR